MAVTDWWLGENGSDWATVICRSNATATVTVTCNGRDFTGSADTSVNDGIVEITVTGLTDTRVAYSVDGVAGGTLRAKKSRGPYWVASGSCWSKVRPDMLAYALLRDYDLDAYFALGDFPYCNTGSTALGETTVNVTSSIANATNASNYLAHHRQQRRVPGIKELMRSVPFVYMADDHEYMVDNARRDLDWWQNNPDAAESQPTATAQNLTDAWAAARAAIEAYATGNPVNTDAGIDSDALYTRFTVGPAEFFLLDCINYGTRPDAADDASKTMLGASQKAWLIAAILASTATFKVIVSPKQFWRGGTNTDAWHAHDINPGYQTELKEILYAIRSVTGVMAVAGDQHRYSDQFVAAGDLGAGYPAMSCFVGCPTTVDPNPTSYVGYDSQIVMRDNGRNSVPTSREDFAVALLKISDTTVERYLLTTLRGLMPLGYIEAGSNDVQYARPKIG